jgi:hypothetical protein
MEGVFFVPADYQEDAPSGAMGPSQAAQQAGARWTAWRGSRFMRSEFDSNRVESFPFSRRAVKAIQQGWRPPAVRNCRSASLDRPNVFRLHEPTSALTLMIAETLGRGCPPIDRTPSAWR